VVSIEDAFEMTWLRFSSWFGDRGRLARTGWRPADQIEGVIKHETAGHRRPPAIGGTPMAATGTVAIPIFRNAFVPRNHFALGLKIS
jgi:hypothetical protein